MDTLKREFGEWQEELSEVKETWLIYALTLSVVCLLFLAAITPNLVPSSSTPRGEKVALSSSPYPER